MSFGTPFPASGRSEISLLEQSMREKDNIIQAQYAELVVLRRQHELALEGVKHWRGKYIERGAALTSIPRAEGDPA